MSKKPVKSQVKKPSELKHAKSRKEIPPVQGIILGLVLKSERTAYGNSHPSLPDDCLSLMPHSTSVTSINYPVGSRLLCKPGSYLRDCVVQSVCWVIADEKDGVVVREAGHVYQIKQLCNGLTHMLTERDINLYYYCWVPVEAM